MTRPPVSGMSNPAVKSARQCRTTAMAQVTGVRFAAGSRLLLTTSIDGSTRVWNLPETALAGPLLQSASIVQAPDVSPDLIVATPTQGGAVDLWSIMPVGSTSGTRHSPRPLASLPHGAMASVRFDASGRFLVSAGSDGLVRVWDVAPALPAPPDLVVDEGDFHWRAVPSADGSRLAVSSGASPSRAAYRVFDPATGAPVTPTMRLEGLNIALAMSGDARILATAATSGSIRLWDARHGEPLSPLINDGAGWSRTVLSPDGMLFAVASTDEGGNAVRVRRTADGSSVTEPLRQAGPVLFIDFSADSRRLLIASDGWEVEYHDVGSPDQSTGVGRHPSRRSIGRGMEPRRPHRIHRRRRPAGAGLGRRIRRARPDGFENGGPSQHLEHQRRRQTAANRHRRRKRRIGRPCEQPAAGVDAAKGVCLRNYF